MKKLFSLTIFLMAAFACADAQNIQLHYDLGHTLYSDLTPRQSVTTTVEMFKPDKWGSTFFFIDLDYKNDGVKEPIGRLHVSSMSRRISSGQCMWSITEVPRQARPRPTIMATGTSMWHSRRSMELAFQ